jgi:hypothetical protein
MKYVSCEALQFVFEKETDKAIAFRGEGRLLWVPKSQIKIAINDSDSLVFFIRSFYFMTHLRHKLHDPYTKHYEGSTLIPQFKQFIDALDKEVVFA